YLPSPNAIHQTIQRIRHLDLSMEPLSLEDLIIPDHIKRTLSGLDFLIHDSTVERNGILIFTTVDNIRHLNRSTFWVMDGTFQTVPNMFRQLCTIHRCVGRSKNSRVLPLVFCLMTSKLEEFYRRLFEELIDFGEEHNINLDPYIVLTNFEAAAINSVQLEFDDVQGKSCYFHFSQYIYRKVQAYGLASRYELKTHIPAKAEHVIRWFEETFIYDRKEQNRVELDIKAILRSAPRPPQRRHNIEHEQCIQTVFNDYGNKTIMEYLRGIAHNLAF
ncbi:39023_t:CDS:2, partial [Gigaspora margarita]